MRQIWQTYTNRLLNMTATITRQAERSELTNMPIGDPISRTVKCYRLDKIVYDKDGTKYSYPNQGPYIVKADEDVKAGIDSINGQIIQAVNDYNYTGDSRLGYEYKAMFKQIITSG